MTPAAMSSPAPTIAPRKGAVESSSPLSSPPADLDTDAVHIYASGKVLKRATRSLKRITGRKRKAGDNNDATEQSAPKARKTAKGKAKLSKATVIEDSDDEEQKDGGDPKQPGKKTRKDRRKLDGPQQPWTSDEHNLLFQLVLDHLGIDWDLHRIYVEFNKILSDTAVRPEGCKLPAGECNFRTTWIPYTGGGVSKEVARRHDQKWRSFESLRNRVQWFLAVVKKWRRSDKSKAWMRPLWEPCEDNEAETWPKRNGEPAPPKVHGQYSVHACASLWDYYALNEVAEKVGKLKKEGKFPDHVPEEAAPGDDVEDIDAFVIAQEEDDVPPKADGKGEQGGDDGAVEEGSEDSQITSEAAVAKKLQAEYDAEGEALLAARAAAAEKPGDQQPEVEQGEGTGEQTGEAEPTPIPEQDITMEDAE